MAAYKIKTRMMTRSQRCHAFVPIPESVGANDCFPALEALSPPFTSENEAKNRDEKDGLTPELINSFPALVSPMPMTPSISSTPPGQRSSMLPLLVTEFDGNIAQENGCIRLTQRPEGAKIETTIPDADSFAQMRHCNVAPTPGDCRDVWNAHPSENASLQIISETGKSEEVIQTAASILYSLKSAQVSPSIAREIGSQHPLFEPGAAAHDSAAVSLDFVQNCFENKLTSKDYRAGDSMRLALPEDAQELNSLHCYVRSDLLELFVLPGPDDEVTLSRSSSTSPSLSEEDDNEEDEISAVEPQDVATKTTFSPGKKPARLYTGRVGLRCVHCAHLPRRCRSGSSMSTFYPKSIKDIYRSVCTWQRVHFRTCRHIPPTVRKTYWDLKDGDRTRGKTRYWVMSAKRMGLVDVDGPSGRGGIRFASTKVMEVG